MRLSRRRALVLAALGSPNVGCPATCVGAGCEEQFDASFLSLFLGATARPQVASPLDGDITVVGDAISGPDWDAAIGSGRIVIGSPGDGSVRGFGADHALGSELLANAPGLLAGDADDAFGASVAILGDVDGDGEAELLVGAPTFDAGSAHDGGAVYLYSGLGSGLTGDAIATTPTLQVSGESTTLHFGEVVRGCADMDGDGLPEWVAAAPLGGRELALSGEIALASSHDFGVLDPEILMGDLGTKARSGGVFWGSSIGAGAGSALDCLHDMTGDGLADLWIGAPYADGTHDGEGAAYLVASSSSGPVKAGDLDTTATAALHGDVEEAWLGNSVATGMFDGDLLADVAVGAPGSSAVAADGTPAFPGEVLLWRGATFQADAKSRQDVRITGAEDGDRFGETVAFADVDGDGLDDLLVGAPHHNPDPNDADAAFQSGALYIFLGKKDEIPANLSAADADVEIVEAAQFLRTGERTAVGDYDDDGRADFAIVDRFDPSASPFQ